MRSFISCCTKSLMAVSLMLALSTVILVSTSHGGAAQIRKGPETIADISEKLLDTVVNISTSQRVPRSQSVQVPDLPADSPFREFFDDFLNKHGQGQGQGGDDTPQSRTPQRVSSLGSGFIIDASGIVITNNHVVDAADEITVILHDGQKLKAKLLGKDAKTDIAVLKVESTAPLPFARFADSDKSRIGEWVVAIGNPFGLGGSVSAGIISARNRDIQAGPYDDFIQTDAAINRGNSGGPLFNMDGEVVGITTAIISPGGGGGSVGIGFAVPSNIAQNVISQIQKFGEIRRGWLGVRITAVTDDIAESLGLPKAKGALIAGVSKDGPAEKAGILTGDVVVNFAGHDITSPRDLSRTVADTGIDSATSVTVFRKGKEQKLSVKVGRLEEDKQAAATDDNDEEADKPAPPAGKSMKGLKLSALSPSLRAQYRVDKDIKGVVVTAVDQNSLAGERRIQVGDTIVEVSQESVASPEDIEKRFADLSKQGRKSALLLIANAKGELRFVTLPLKD